MAQFIELKKLCEGLKKITSNKEIIRRIANFYKN